MSSAAAPATTSVANSRPGTTPARPARRPRIGRSHSAQVSAAKAVDSAIRPNRVAGSSGLSASIAANENSGQCQR